MYDVLVHQISIREVIRTREIDVACASIDLAGAEIAMSTRSAESGSLQKALKEVEDDYDFVFIDTPPSLGLLTINALTVANKVIVPVQCEYLSMRGLIQLQNTLAMIRENLNPDVEIEGILPTLVDARTLHAKEAIELLEENFGDRVFASRIRKTVRFRRGSCEGHVGPQVRSRRSGRTRLPAAREGGPFQCQALSARVCARDHSRLCSQDRKTRSAPVQDTDDRRRRKAGDAAGAARRSVGPRPRLRASRPTAADTSRTERHGRGGRGRGRGAADSDSRTSACATPSPPTSPNVLERPTRPAPEPVVAPPTHDVYARAIARRVACESRGRGGPVLRVVGVGGAGVNAVNRMIEAEIEGVEFMAINTDLQSLQTVGRARDAPHRRRRSRTGSGRVRTRNSDAAAAREEYDRIKAMLRGSDMVFIAAGAGGGTGTGAAPVVAQIARELGALTVGIVTRPFQFEGTRRRDTGGGWASPPWAKQSTL